MLAACALLLGGCDLGPKTLSPDLEVTTNLPLLDETIDIGKHISEADSILVNPDNPNELLLRIREENIDLGNNGTIGQDRLDTQDQAPQTVGAPAGAIHLDDVPPTVARVQLTDVDPRLGSLPPGTVTLPAASLPAAKQQITFQSIKQVTFSQTSTPSVNRLRLSLRNRTPLAMDTVRIILSASGDTLPTGQVKDVIGQAILVGVAKGDSAVAPDIDLAGKTLANPSYLVTRVRLAATTTTKAELTAAYFNVVADMTPLEVESAWAQIPPQEYSRDRFISFTNEKLQLIRVDLADLGLPGMNEFRLVIRNDMETDINLTYDLPDFAIPHAPVSVAGGAINVVRPGDYASARIFMPAGATTNILFDLDGARLANAKALGQPVSQVEIGLDVQIVGTGASFANIRATDSVAVMADLSTLAIQSVEGRVPADQPPIVATIDPFTLSVEDAGVPAGLQGFQARALTMSMLMTALSTRVTADADLMVEVLGAGGVPRASYHWESSRKIEPGVQQRFTISQDSLDAQNHSPIDIVNAMLDDIFATDSSSARVSGQVDIRGDVRLVRDSSRIEIPEVSIAAPLIFNVTSAQTFDAKGEGEAGFEVDLDSSVREDVIPHVMAATLVAEVENYFPIGGTVVVFASPDSLFLRLRAQYPAEDRAPVATIPGAMPAGATIADEAGAIAQNAVFKLFTVTMPEPQRLPNGAVDYAHPGKAVIEVTLDDEIQLFKYRELYLLPRIQLVTAPGLVQLRPQDYVKVNAWVQFKAKT